MWFIPPAGQETQRRVVTRERVVAEALAVIAENGVDALSMRALATRLGVVPGALYRHVRSKEQLHDLVLDEVLAEADTRIERPAPWTEQIRVLTHRLRAVAHDASGPAPRFPVEVA
jgi:AcrR family transcriptional regulator